MQTQQECDINKKKFSKRLKKIPLYISLQSEVGLYPSTFASVIGKLTHVRKNNFKNFTVECC